MSDVPVVYLLWHSHGDPHDANENAKVLGLYASRENAEDRIRRCAATPGFRDYPDGFVVDEYEVDKDQWTEGFVEADEDSWGPEGWKLP